MAGNPALYVPGASTQHRSRVETIFNQIRQQHPGAWAKCTRPNDDGEFNARVAWACKQAGIPAFRNGKRGNVGDLSKDVLVFENPTGARDRAGTFAGIEIIDFIPGHEGGGASFGWQDVTTFPVNGVMTMPDGAAVVPVDPGGAAPGPTPVPVPPTPPKKVYPGDGVFVTKVGDPLAADYRAAGQVLNAGSATWFARTIWDHVNEGLTLDESIAKHRAEWKAALGLQP